jgi:hypothetical protein
MSKVKRVRISNESLNSYGTRVLTSGMNVEQYNRNPVLLYMHVRGQVIGLVKDLRIEGDEVTGELVFDEATDLSCRCKKQWEFGSLKMVSVGIDVLETSADAEFLVQGQTHATITKSKLFEVSIVDVGANDDAIVLHKDGVRLTLGKGAADVLPPLHIDNNKKQRKEMDQEKLALMLGLGKDADEASIESAIDNLKKSEQEVGELKKENETLVLERIEDLVTKAIKEKKISLGKKEHFVQLGKKIGADELKETLDAMSPVVKGSELINGGHGENFTEYKKLSDVPAEILATMRKNDIALYKKLYKAEYGIDCDMNR